MRKFLFLLFLLTAETSVWADPARQDADWLKTVAFAAHQTDYSGIFFYQAGKNGRVEVSRITHLADPTGEHERMESLDGERREVVRHNDRVWLYLGDNKVRVEKRQCEERTFPALLPEQISALQENYSIRQGEEDRVAGFHAHSVILQPKDNLRYSRKMWMHSDSGLLLKTVVTDERGQLIEQYAFTQLSIGRDIDRKWLNQNKMEVAPDPALSPLPKAGVVVNSNSWKVDALPAGFKKILEMRRTLRSKKTPVTHLVFSDGLAGVSVFIEDVEPAASVATGLSTNGSMQIYNRVNGDKLITVVGEVPPRTVIQIADSVRFAGQ